MYMNANKLEKDGEYNFVFILYFIIMVRSAEIYQWAVIVSVLTHNIIYCNIKFIVNKYVFNGLSFYYIMYIYQYIIEWQTNEHIFIDNEFYNFKTGPIVNETVKRVFLRVLY